MKRWTFARSAIAVSILAVCAAGYSHFGVPGLSHVKAQIIEQATRSAPAVGRAVPVTTPATDFSGIVERFGPAVVNISIIGKTQRTALSDDLPGLDPNDPFFEFFRRFGPPLPRSPQEYRILRGQGSGFIVNTNGLILTNAHVVDGAQEVTVKLTDRREFKARVLGADPLTDVAVIKIDAKNLPTVRLGDPALTKVGEPVLAIGSPYGFENTATSGIVSAKSRLLPDDTYVPFIQTDAAVNPGSSGGPLFNLKGEVIGINSQIYSQTGGYQGLSFAIPIDVATKVQAQLIEHGKVTRGRLGVTIQEVNQALADTFGLKKPQGALISSVEKGSPAEKAGLQPGDVIVRVDDREINRSADLPVQVADLKPGSIAKLEIMRKGAPKTLSVTVGEMKGAKITQSNEGNAAQGRLGLAVRPLARDERQQLGNAGGLVVEEATGPAARDGIQVGDVILSFDGTPVSSAEQLRNLVDNAGKNVALRVQRGAAKIFIPVDLG